MRRMTVSAGLAAALLLACCWSAAAYGKEKIKVGLKVVGSGSTAVLQIDKLKTSGPKCQKKIHDGCFEVAKGKSAEFKVTLPGSDKDCGHNAKWKLSKVLLGGEGKVDSPPDKPAAWGNISQDAADDLGAEKVSGLVNTTWDGNRTLQFDDANRHEFSIWYNVWAESCDEEPIFIKMDPRVDNKGS